MKRIPTTVFILAYLASACTRVVTDTPTPMSGHEAEWRAAGRRALRDQLAIRPSFQEIVAFSPERPTAVGYRLNLQRGQRVRIELEKRTRAKMFTEIYEEIGPGEPIFRLVASTDKANSLDFEAHTDGPHVIRVQPELYKGGEVAITVTTAASLAFPVEGKSKRAIGSLFGDSRDGGKRDHEGVDIFATAGTPVVAVADGVISNVSTTSLGGNVVWQEDLSRGVSYYYAHLKTQNVSRGDRVKAGDIVGTVGNTGNARTTPSHLHFGVYKPGRVALDPVPFLFDQPSDPVLPVLVDLSKLGQNVNMAGTDVYVLGGVRDQYRVLLSNGREAFVPSRELTSSYAKGAH
ncbi:MAG TPA: M23 family metallopeptidase [Longimicrobiales bacterium]|nr:M23 family metallopeptidase [Longimicrobiales bacterium]